MSDTGGPTPNEPSIDELIAAQRLREAAVRCACAGEIERAISLLEQDAAFSDAVQLALDHGLAARAMRIAAATADSGMLEAAAGSLSRSDAEVLSHDLARRGFHAAAAHAFTVAGDHRAAAEAWRRAGDLSRAGRAYREAGDAMQAARALSERLREQPHDGDSAVMLGKLLLEHGKPDAAAKVLQGVAASSPRAAEAKGLLAACFERLGLAEARRSLGEVEAVEVAQAPADGPLLHGRFTAVRTVATTLTARVLECTDRVTGERVALKMLRISAGHAAGRDAAARFAREARALALLRSPHILPLVAYIADGPTLVTPWMAGGSLADRLAREPMAPDRAVEIACAVLGALAQAHRVGILHRDVKPSNVLFDEAGAAYLADFGAAHLADTAATVTAGLIGTLGYMAPEQLAGEKASLRSDIYATGVMLLECITGARPGANGPSVLPSQAFDELTPMHDEAVLSLVAREQAARPESAEAAISRLAALSFKVDRRARRRASSLPPPPQSAQERLARGEGALAHDAVLDRPVQIVERASLLLPLARAMAPLSVPALPAVYRHDAAADALWVEPAPGVSLAQLGRPLTAGEAASLAHALSLLHQSGVAHGHVDRDHVFVDPQRGPFLAFPDALRAEATVRGDLVSLAALEARLPPAT